MVGANTGLLCIIIVAPQYHCITLDCSITFPLSSCLSLSITYWHSYLAEIPRLVKHVDESFLQKVLSLTCPPENYYHAIEPDAQSCYLEVDHIPGCNHHSMRACEVLGEHRAGCK